MGVLSVVISLATANVTVCLDRFRRGAARVARRHPGLANRVPTALYASPEVIALGTILKAWQVIEEELIASRNQLSKRQRHNPVEPWRFIATLQSCSVIDPATAKLAYQLREDRNRIVHASGQRATLADADAFTRRSRILLTRIHEGMRRQSH